MAGLDQYCNGGPTRVIGIWHLPQAGGGAGAVLGSAKVGKQRKKTEENKT